MNSPEAPKYPTAKDLKPILDLSQGYNTQTAVNQARLNNVNQVTPYGTLTYSVQRNAKGKPVLVNGVPQYTATQALSPEEQSLLTGQQKVQAALNATAQNEANGLAGSLAKPLDLSSSSIGADIAAMYNPRLDEQWNKNYQDLQADLANRGIREGSEAYDHAMNQFQQGKNDAYNQVMINARDQAVNEMLQQRDQPLNEIAALESGSPVQGPSFQTTPQTGIGDTNTLTAANNQYNASLNSYNAQLQQQNAFTGGLFGLGSSLLGGWAMSDERVKEDAEKVGELDDGTKVYSFRYKGRPLQHLGVMAQEIEKKYPEAVAKTPSGYKAVNYSRVAERVAA